MARIFITGSNGYIGSHLIKNLKLANYTIFAPSRQECDITDYKQLEGQIQKDDIVVHLAGRLTGSKEELLLANIIGVDNVAEVCKTKEAHSLIYISTSTQIFELDPFSEYKKSKIIGEKIIEKYGIRNIILRVSNVYGPDQPNGLINKIIKSCKSGERLEMPNIKRDFLFVEDLTKAIEFAIRLCISTPPYMYDQKIFDVCSGKLTRAYDIMDFVEGKIDSIESKPYESNQPRLLVTNELQNLNTNIKDLIEMDKNRK